MGPAGSSVISSQILLYFLVWAQMEARKFRKQHTNETAETLKACEALADTLRYL